MMSLGLKDDENYPRRTKKGHAAMSANATTFVTLAANQTTSATMSLSASSPATTVWS
jgi:hypothetical protein